MHSYFLGDPAKNGPTYFRYNLSVGEATLYVHPMVNTTYGFQMHNNVFSDFKGNFGRNVIASDLLDTVARNNIFYMAPGVGGALSLPAGSDYNLYYNVGRPAGEAHSIGADPQFVDPGDPPNGLRLRPTSPAINAGISIPDNGGRDYWGNALYAGAADIGAHESHGEPAPGPPGGDLSLHKAVSASSSIEAWGWSKAKAVDGSIHSVPSSNGWISQGTPADHTEWVAIDLGASHPVKMIKLYPRDDTGYIGDGFPVDFRVEVSADNVSWTTVVAKTGYTKPGPAAQGFAFGEVAARYVKITGTALPKGEGGTYSMAFAEVEVLDETSPAPESPAPSGNLALSQDVSASSSAENWGWFKTKLVDGSRDSLAGAMGWSSWGDQSANHTEWVKVDLGSVRGVSRVDLYARNDAGNVGSNFPSDFSIKVSANGIDWAAVVTRSGFGAPTNAVQSFTFAAQMARYVKVEGTNLRSMAFAELEIYE
jgi:hypothetical protein